MEEDSSRFAKGIRAPLYRPGRHSPRCLFVEKDILFEWEHYCKLKKHIPVVEKQLQCALTALVGQPLEVTSNDSALSVDVHFSIGQVYVLLDILAKSENGLHD